MAKFEPIEFNSYKPLSEIVYDKLRTAIIEGTLNPGERLMEVQLAEEMGISRTPVREAIRKLELDGFVVMVPRKGTYVSTLSLKDISDVFEIRASLEALAAGLAAERITPEEEKELKKIILDEVKFSKNEDVENSIKFDTDFHEVLYKASRNKKLVNIINNLREQIQRYRTASLTYPGRLKIAHEEHKKIAEAICDNDVERAKELAKKHIEISENNLLEMLRKNNKLV
jgi:DNA-binding GntR family transcriptional regulator